MVTQLVVGGIQLIFFGILGEYLGRVYITEAGRPQATIREVLNRTTHEDSVRNRSDMSSSKH